MNAREVVATLFAVMLALSGPATGVVYGVESNGDEDEGARTYLSACTVVTRPGVYELTRDVVSDRYDCFRIESDSVVFDGGGHTVQPSDRLRELGERLLMPTPGHVGVGVRVGYADGVASATVSDVSVSNVTLVGFDAGVSVSDAEGVTLTGIEATDDVTGIAVDRSRDVVVRDSVVTGSLEDGVVVRDSADVVIADATVRDSLVAGVVFDSVREGRLERVTVRDNGGDGVLVVASEATVLTDVTATSNGVGVLLMDSAGAKIGRTVAERNAFAGVGLVRSNGTVVTDLRVGETTGAQRVLAEPSELWLFASAGNCFENVSVGATSGWVVYARDGSSENRVNAADGRTTASFVAGDVAVAFAESMAEPPRAETTSPLVVERVGENGTFEPSPVDCRR